MCVDISFIIPLYNKESYIVRCVESIIAQQLSSYEILIIDDCSTDSSFEKVKKYIAYNNIHLKKNQENKGAAYTRNIGVDSACGKYIWFIDADDYIRDKEAGKLLDMLKNYRLNMLCFDMAWEGSYGIIDKKLLNINRTDVLSGEELFCLIGESGIVRASACGQIYSLNYIKQNELKFSEGMMAEDAYFSVKAMLMAERAMYVSQTAYVYSEVQNSVTWGTEDFQYFIGCFNAYCDIREFWEQHVANPEVKYYLIPFITTYYRSAKKHFRLEDLNRIREWVENGRKYVSLQYRIFECTEIEGHYLKWLNEEQIRNIKEAEELIIYGAGNVAHDLLPFLQLLDKRIIAYAVSNHVSGRKSWYGVPIELICNLAVYRNRALVVVAVTQKYYEEVKVTLKTYGFEKVLWIFQDR